MVGSTPPRRRRRSISRKRWVASCAVGGLGRRPRSSLPSVPRLLTHAAELEAQRDHVLRRRDGAEGDELAVDEAERAQRRETEPGPGVQPLTSEATLDRVVYDGGVFEGHVLPSGADEEEFLGIPGLLEPAEVSALLRQRRSADVGSSAAAASTGSGATAGDRRAVPRTTARQLADLRAELNSCARAYARQFGVTPAVAHSEARRASGGPPAAADATQLEARIDYLRRRAVGRR